jgi:hypothetical protein
MEKINQKIQESTPTTIQSVDMKHETEQEEEEQNDELFNLNDDLFSSFDSLHSIQSSSTFDFIPFGDY